MSCVSKMSLTPSGIPCSDPARGDGEPVELAGTSEHGLRIHVNPRAHARIATSIRSRHARATASTVVPPLANRWASSATVLPVEGGDAPRLIAPA